MEDFEKLGFDVDVATGMPMPLVAPGEGVARKDENGIEASISFLSVDSDAGRSFDRRARAEQERKLRGGRRFNSGDDEELVLNKVCALGTAWHLVSPDGKHVDIPFSQENLRKFLAAPSRQDVMRAAAIFCASAANFTKASSTS